MEDNGLIFTRSASGLVKELSWWDVFIIAISAPTGFGILYFSVSNASSYPGGNVSLSFFIGLLIFLPICALAAITSATIPRSGSLYVLISRVLDPAIGYLAAFLFLLGYGLSIGVVAFVISGILGGIMVSSGVASKIALLQDLGSALQTPLCGTIGGIAWVILLWIIVLTGVKVFRNAMRVLFIIPGIAILITILYFLFTSPGNAETTFNHSWGAGVFQTILDAAKANGWASSKFSWSSTLGLLLIVIWAYGGIEMVSYASGEVRIPRTSMIRGFIFGWAAIGLLYIGLSYSVYRPFGEFISTYDFLFRNHLDTLKNIMPAVNPSVPFYIASIIRNPWVGVLIAFSLVLWLVNTMLPYFMGPSRLIFALAMDRAIPEKLASVNPKNGAPTWASHITMAIAILGVILNVLGVKVLLATIEFAAFFVFWLYGLSAMLLPYRRPEIYERSVIKAEILGLPLISLLGFLTFAVGWFVMFFTINHMTMQVSLTAVMVMTLGMAIYFWQQARNMKRGIDLTMIYSKIYSKIPPE